MLLLEVQPCWTALALVFGHLFTFIDCRGLPTDVQHAENLYYQQPETLGRRAGAVSFRITRPGYVTTTHSCDVITDVPDHLRSSTHMAPRGLEYFYQKYTEAYNIPVVGSADVPDDALRRACYVVRFIFADREDFRREYYKNYGRFGIIGVNEVTTDIPEYSDMDSYWNTRARGLGATLNRPIATAGEENALCYSSDLYREDIVLHEFAHAIDLLGIKTGDTVLSSRLNQLYHSAMDQGLWQNTYAATNREEYFAEGVQSYFNAEDYSSYPNGIHNHVNTRAKLQIYDPDLHDFIAEVFPCGNHYVQRCDRDRDAEAQTLRMNCVQGAGSSESDTGNSDTGGNGNSDNVGSRDISSSSESEEEWEESYEQESCTDENEHCNYWAHHGWCSRSHYMTQYCQLSCQLCDSDNDRDNSYDNSSEEDNNNNGRCTDDNRHCAYWAGEGECTRYAAYMRTNCRLSCHLC